MLGAEWSLGFAFSAEDKGLKDYLDGIQTKSTDVSKAFDAMAKSLSSVSSSTSGYGKAQKEIDAFLKSKAATKESEIPGPEVSAMEVSPEDKESEKISNAYTANLTAIYAAYDKLGIKTGVFTEKSRQQLDELSDKILETVNKTSKKTEVLFGGASRRVVKTFDKLFDALEKGTLETLPDFQEIPRVLMSIPGMAVHARRALMRLLVDKKLTSQKVIDFLQIYQTDIKKALEGTQKVGKAWESAKGFIGDSLTTLFPEDKEYGKLFDIAHGLTTAIAEMTDNGELFGKVWKGGVDLFKGMFKKKDAVVDDMKAISSASEQTKKETAANMAEVEKLRENAFADPLEGYKETVPFEVKGLSEEDINELAENAELAAEMMGSSYAEALSKKIDESNKNIKSKIDVLWEKVPKTLWVDSEEAKKESEVVAKVTEDITKSVKDAKDKIAEEPVKPDLGEASSEALEEAKKALPPEAKAVGAETADALAKGVEDGLSKTPIFDALKGELSKIAGFTEDQGKAAAAGFIKGVDGVISGSDFATPLNAKIERDLKLSDATLEKVGSSAGLSIINAIKKALSGADLAVEIKEASLKGVLDTSVLNTAIDELKTKLTDLKHHVTLVTHDISGDVHQGLSLTLKRDFERMSLDLDSFVRKVSDTAPIIKNALADLRITVYPKSEFDEQLARFDAIGDRIDATKRKVQAYLQQLDAPSPRVPEETMTGIGESRQELAEKQTATKSEEQILKLVEAIKTSGVTPEKMAALNSLVQSLRLSISRVEAAVREKKLSVGVTNESTTDAQKMNDTIQSIVNDDEGRIKGGV